MVSLFFLRKRSREPACASGKELFLSEISEALERCPVNSEEPLNSWSLLNVLGFCWIFEILRYFSEYFSKEDSKNISQIFFLRTLDHRSHFGSSAGRFLLPSLPHLLTACERNLGARCSANLSK